MFGVPLGLTPHLSLPPLEYTDKYLVIDIYEAKEVVLDISEEKQLILSRRNNFSPVQKWIANTTGNNWYFDNNYFKDIQYHITLIKIETNVTLTWDINADNVYSAHIQSQRNIKVYIMLSGTPVDREISKCINKTYVGGNPLAENGFTNPNYNQHPWNSPWIRDYFTCSSGDRIHPSLKCDRVPNCPAGDDEDLQLLV